MNPGEVLFKSTHLEVDSTGDFESKIIILIAPSSDSTYLVNLTIQSAQISRYTAPLPEGALDKTISGRVFDRSTEVRWQLHGSRFDLWILTESEKEGCAVRPERMKFYGVGTWNSKSKAFIDGRLPKQLEYPRFPEADESNFTKNSRLYFDSKAYYPLLDLAHSNEAELLAKLNTQLNLPRCIGYRLTGIGVDNGEKR